MEGWLNTSVFWVVTRREVVWNQRFRTIGPVFKNQTVQKKDTLTRKDSNDRWSRNVGMKPPHAA